MFVICSVGYSITEILHIQNL